MTEGPWPLAILLHTISAPDKRQERSGPTPPRWSGAPTRRSIYGPHGKETPSGPWTFRTSTRGQSHTPARQPPSRWPNRGQQNPQWVVCMFSPADAYIAVCDPERLTGPEAVIRVAVCACMIVRALREGHALLLKVRLKPGRAPPT